MVKGAYGIDCMLIGDKEFSWAQLTGRNCSNFKTTIRELISDNRVPTYIWNSPKQNRESYDEAQSPIGAKESFSNYYVEKAVREPTSYPHLQTLGLLSKLCPQVYRVIELQMLCWYLDHFKSRPYFWGVFFP